MPPTAEVSDHATRATAQARALARPPADISSQALYFPAACLWAGLVLPWSVLAILGLLPAPVRLATPTGHAHEMLLGFALAVVAGYQLPPLPRLRARTLFGLWLAARVAFLAGPVPIMLALALDAAFAAALALHVTPRLFRAAKKLRNRVLPAVLAGLCAAAVGLDGAMLGSAQAAAALAVVVVLLLAGLMTFMGGRLVAAEAAGQLYRQGEVLTPRVQPRIEAAVLVLLATALASAVHPAGDWLLRLACAGAGVLSLVRMARWRLWACRGRPDLVSLASGYLWLALGLLGMGLAAPGAARTAALHLVTVGALGSFTLNVMLNTMLLKARLPREEQRLPLAATACIALAALLRATAAFAGADAQALLLLASACWSAGFVAAFVRIVQCVRRATARARMAPGRPA